MDRGRYAGPVGWMDADGDGEWGIALRCAQLDGTRAGCSPVAGSSRTPTPRPSSPSRRPSSYPSGTPWPPSARPPPPTPREGTWGQAGSATHRIGSPAPRSVIPGVVSACHQGAPVGGERQHVGDHPAVREDLGRLADAHRRTSRRAGPARHTSRTWPGTSGPPGQPGAHDATALRGLDGEVVGTVVMAAFHMSIWPISRDSSERRVGLSSTPSTETSIGASSWLVAQRRRPRSTISPTSQTWCSTILTSRSMERHLRSRGQPQAAGGMEVHAVRRLDLDPRAAACASRDGVCAVRPGERAGERLVRGVAGLDRDVEDPAVAGQQAVRRPLEQDPAAEPRRRLAGGGRDDPVEVEPRHVSTAGDVRAVDTGLVERLLQHVDEPAERVGRDAHDRPSLRQRRPGGLDPDCSHQRPQLFVDGPPVRAVDRDLQDSDARHVDGQRLAQRRRLGRRAGTPSRTPRRRPRCPHARGCRRPARTPTRTRAHPARAWRRSRPRRRWRPRWSGRAPARGRRTAGRCCRAGTSGRPGRRTPATTVVRARCRRPSTPCRRCPTGRGWRWSCRRPPTRWVGIIRSRSRTGFEDPTTSRPPGGSVSPRMRATVHGDSPGWPSSSASTRRPTAASAARQASSQAASSRCATLAAGTTSRRPVAHVRPRAVPVGATTTSSTSGRESRAVTARDSVG